MEGYPVPRAPIPEFLEILKPGNEKGVPKKIQSLIYEAGVKNQNFEILKNLLIHFITIRSWGWRCHDI